MSVHLRPGREVVIGDRGNRYVLTMDSPEEGIRSIDNELAIELHTDSPGGRLNVGDREQWFA